MQKRARLIALCIILAVTMAFQTATIGAAEMQTDSDESPGLNIRQVDSVELERLLSEIPPDEQELFRSHFNKKMEIIIERELLLSKNPFMFMIDEYEVDLHAEVSLDDDGFSFGHENNRSFSLAKDEFELFESKSIMPNNKEPKLIPVAMKRYIVKYRDGCEEAARSILEDKVESFEEASIYTKDEVFTQAGNNNSIRSGFEYVTLETPRIPSEFAKELNKQGLGDNIEYIQPDYELSLESISLELEDVIDNYNATLSETDSENEDDSIASDVVKNLGEDLNNPVIVAVIDTGIDINHKDISDYVWTNLQPDENKFDGDINGWNFVSENGNLYDDSYPSDSSHGTHIAGIIANTAKKYDAAVQIMPLKVFENGSAYTSDIIAAIQYAVFHGASIINCSFGSSMDNPALLEAVSSSGALIVASAGNSRRNIAENPIYPAAYDMPNIISVGSVNTDGGYSYFSNYGDTIVNIAALGRDVVSTFPENQEGPMTGTSMSAAAVSAAAAVVLDVNSAVGAEELKERLVYTADKLENLQNKTIDGRRLNIENAINNIEVDNIININPADDFDVHGYQSTPEEEWELFSSSKIVQIAAGTNHTLARKEDGTVWAWGYNISGQLGDGTTTSRTAPVQVLGLSNVVSIAAGGSSSLAVKGDGTLWSWGSNNYGQLGNGATTNKSTPVQVSGLTNVVSITAGVSHSVAVRQDKTVWSWGFNGMGQLGDGTKTNRATPVQVSGLSDVISISSKYMHNLAVKGNGTAWAWGDNSFGILGDGTSTLQSIPVQVSGLSNVVAVAAGRTQSLALRGDGRVWSWGSNNYGQVGNGSSFDTYTPVQVSLLTNVISIATGENHSFALKSDGTVSTWGRNNYGQLGDGTITNRSTPVQISGPSNIALIAAGDFHSLALKNDGTVWAWGYNNYGQLGDGTTQNRNTPVIVFGDIITEPRDPAIAAGNSFSLLLDEHGDIWSKGKNNYGQLGDGTTIDKSLDAKITTISKVVAVAAGNGHSLALKENGTIWAWGNNFSGQLGDGTNINKTSPVELSGITSVASIAAGSSHSLALKDDGTIWAWGYNGYGQLGNSIAISLNRPTQIKDFNGVTKTSAGGYHSLALKEDGTVWAWGDNTYGQLGNNSTIGSSVPVQVSGLKDITMISAGGYFSLALKSNGTVYAWGWNGEGELGIGTGDSSYVPVLISGLSNVTSISAGGHHGLALKSDKTVWGWGFNGNGQLGSMSGINLYPTKITEFSNTILIAAGENMSVASDSYSSIITLGK